MSYSDPVTNGIEVTPSDATDFPREVRGLYVGVAGNITVVFPDDTTVLFSNVPAGTILPVRVKRINATATTATNIVGLG